MLSNKFCRENLKEFLELFASKEIQYEIWFLRDEKTREDPNEFYCMLFDDFGVENFVAVKNNYLTIKENDELKRFIDMLNDYADKHKDEKGFLDFDSKEVFYDPEWESIRQEAQKLYFLLEKGENIESLTFIEDWHY
ncbi:hypothetical protein KKA17_07095 [bacterium]|nr:hypothetical protein [bacterium]